MQSKKQLKSNVEKHIEPGFQRAGTDWLHMCTYVALLYYWGILILQEQGIFPISLSWKKNTWGEDICVRVSWCYLGKQTMTSSDTGKKKSTAENFLSCLSSC